MRHRQRSMEQQNESSCKQKGRVQKTRHNVSRKMAILLVMPVLLSSVQACGMGSTAVIKKDESVVLSVLAGQSTSDAGVEEMFDAALAKSCPDIKLEWECVDWGEEFDEELRTRFAAGDVPDIIIGKGPSARSIRLDLSPFTLIGATTKAGALAPPLRDRFGVISRLEYYEPEALIFIIQRAAEILEIPIEDRGALEIARRSRGTPRIANRLLKRVRDVAQVSGDGVITDAIADQALAMLEIDKRGLDHTDRRMLDTMIKKFAGGPVGIETLAASISEETDTIEDVYEPYLLQLGFINRTPRGRVVTRAGYEHMGIAFPQDD